MTALGKLFKTTAFKLSVAYLCIFALGAGLVLGSVAFNVKRLFDEQLAATVDAEITGLSEQYLAGGIQRLVDTIVRRAAQPGSSLYLVTTNAGESLAGNVGQLPDGVLARPGVVETGYARLGEGTVRPHRALARIFVLPGGFRLLVGRDLEELETIRGVIGHALLASLFWLVVIGTVGGLVVARRVLKRVDAIAASAQTIMRGDTSRRLPVQGSGDELDRLAQSLNAMLERIGDLMRGLTEVSDNIAHDLKTPLTRMRAGAETALRAGHGPEEVRAALERVIEDSDGLIRIFDALLMIARAEAGSGQEGMQVFDAGAVAADVAELYEPSAEEGGATIVTAIAPGLLVRGSRELIGQTLANLVDNALKYGGGSGIRVEGRRVGDRVEIAIGDGGAGVPVADRTHVLDRFVRLEGARSRPGSGLGLSMAVAIARLHEGELRLEDNRPGLRVVLSLPASHAPLPAPNEPLLLPAPESVA